METYLNHLSQSLTEPPFSRLSGGIPRRNPFFLKSLRPGNHSIGDRLCGRLLRGRPAQGFALLPHLHSGTFDHIHHPGSGCVFSRWPVWDGQSGMVLCRGRGRRGYRHPSYGFQRMELVAFGQVPTEKEGDPGSLPAWPLLRDRIVSVRNPHPGSHPHLGCVQGRSGLRNVALVCLCRRPLRPDLSGRDSHGFC